MRRTPANSSNIAEIGYDPDTSTLEIKFHNGGVYQYVNVPSEIHIGLMNAASKGSYFHRCIRERYRTTRIK